MKISVAPVGAAILACLIACDPTEPVPASEGEPSVESGATPLTSSASTPQNPGWMYSIVHDGTYLSDLTIPGTHDSGALSDPVSQSGTAKAQDLTIPEQLNAGVRFFDIRLNFSPGHVAGVDDDLYVFHGVVPQLVRADTVFQWFTQFLDTNRGEMLLVSLKDEAQTVADDSGFQTSVESLLRRYSSRILSTSSVPMYTSHLADTRRIVIVRRYPLVHASAEGAPATIDATQGWPAGSKEAAIANVGSALEVEDRYDFVCSGLASCTLENSEELAMRAEKFSFVKLLFTDAFSTEGDFDGAHRLRVAFASASLHPAHNPLPTNGVIPWFAGYVNGRIHSEISGIYRARAGAILLDRASPTLVNELVNMNRLRPFEAGPASTSGGRAIINPTSDFFCGGAAKSVCFFPASGGSVNLGGTAFGRPAVALGANNNETSVFVVGKDRALYTRWQTSPTSQPSAFNADWVSLGGAPLTSDPVAFRNCSGVMEVFARRSDNSIWTTWQTAPGGHWNAWTSIGGQAHSRPTLSPSGCDVTVSVVGTDGKLWNNTRSNWAWGGWKLP